MLRCNISKDDWPADAVLYMLGNSTQGENILNCAVVEDSEKELGGQACEGE